MSAARLVIAASVALLPRRMRARYREEWLGDLAGATEAGLSRAHVALGAFALALRVGGPLARREPPSVHVVERRTRFALGLALAAALVGLTRYVETVPLGGSFATGGLHAAVAMVRTALSAGALFAPSVAVLIVCFTRRTPSRRAAAVWLLAIASTAPIVAGRLDGSRLRVVGEHVFATPGALAFAAALLLVITATVLASAPRRRVVPAGPGAIAATVLGLAALGIALVIGEALIWGAREGGIRAPITGPSAPGTETDALIALGGFVALVMATAGVVAVLARRRRLAPSALRATATVAAAMLVLAGVGVYNLLGYIAWGRVPTLPTADIVPFTQLVIVLVVMVAVGGVRLPRRRSEPIFGAAEVAR